MNHRSISSLAAATLVLGTMLTQAAPAAALAPSQPHPPMPRRSRGRRAQVNISSAPI